MGLRQHDLLIKVGAVSVATISDAQLLTTIKSAPLPLELMIVRSVHEVNDKLAWMAQLEFDCLFVIYLNF
jgi:hypothetical protein